MIVGPLSPLLHHHSGIYNYICIDLKKKKDISLPDLCRPTTIGLFCVECSLLFPMVMYDGGHVG